MDDRKYLQNKWYRDLLMHINRSNLNVKEFSVYIHYDTHYFRDVLVSLAQIEKIL